MKPSRRRWLAAWGIALGAFPASAPVETNRVFLSTEHVDLRVDYSPARTNALTLFVRDEDRSVDHPPEAAVLMVDGAAELSLPMDLPPLGQAGDPLWVLPASQDPNLLYLGLSAERNPAGVFDGPLMVRLVGLDGPGHFFLWQNTPAGDFVFRMNTRDGVDPGDAAELPVGSHTHFNWGFTTNGIYRLTFQAEGRRLGETTNLFSGPTVFTFHVRPLPPSPFQQWQERHWPGETDVAVIGPAGDPDGDGHLNLWEYVQGMPPTNAFPTFGPQPQIVLTTNPPVLAAVNFPTLGLPPDVAFCLWTADELPGPWTPRAVTPVLGPPVTTPLGELQVAYLPDADPVADRPRRFYKVEAILKDQP
ncbi:MAG TPA: choice-of-anchor M domain-containing protein [Verrucomicrobiota bacterium]|nr:choice-of-anchor M domain-containing protein [Verrucomicrobiota bacterium]